MYNEIRWHWDIAQFKQAMCSLDHTQLNRRLTFILMASRAHAYTSHEGP